MLNRRQFLQLSAGAVAAFVAAEAIPAAAFDALPISHTFGVEGRTAYVIWTRLASRSEHTELASLWITDGAKRLCWAATKVQPGMVTVIDTPLVLNESQRLVIEGDVEATTCLAWSEPARGFIPPMTLEYAEL